jgi:hypothetical protein
MAKRRRTRKPKRGSRQPQTTKLPPAPTRTVPDNPTIEQLLEETGNWPDVMLIDIGQELHRTRKVEPVMEDEAPEGASYDELVGITYAPLVVETNGFTVTATPRRIGTDEVAKFAKSSCKRCYSVGKWKVHGTRSIGKNKRGLPIMQPTEYVANCPCAEAAYKKANKHFLIDSQLGEWIALEDLKIEKAFKITVEGLGDGTSKTVVPEVPEAEPDTECNGGDGVQELPGAGGG